MTLRIVQTVMGVAFVVIGFLVVLGALAILILAKSVAMWGVMLALLGVVVAVIGGIIIPNSGVADGLVRFGSAASPYLDYLPFARSGRRATDPLVETPPPPPPEVKGGPTP